MGHIGAMATITVLSTFCVQKERRFDLSQGFAHPFAMTSTMKESRNASLTKQKGTHGTYAANGTQEGHIPPPHLSKLILWQLIPTFTNTQIHTYAHEQTHKRMHTYTHP